MLAPAPGKSGGVTGGRGTIGLVGIRMLFGGRAREEVFFSSERAAKPSSTWKKSTGGLQRIVRVCELQCSTLSQGGL
jgi:hypothetical protein